MFADFFLCYLFVQSHKLFTETVRQQKIMWQYLEKNIYSNIFNVCFDGFDFGIGWANVELVILLKKINLIEWLILLLHK